METQVKFLGYTYRDIVTGFTGVCTGFVVYITGCNQLLLTPKAASPSERPTSEWFDETRLQYISNAEKVVLNKGPLGFDKAAPVK